MSAVCKTVDHGECGSTLGLGSRNGRGNPGEGDIEGRVDTKCHQKHRSIASSRGCKGDAKNIAKHTDAQRNSLP